MISVTSRPGARQPGPTDGPRDTTTFVVFAAPSVHARCLLASTPQQGAFHSEQQSRFRTEGLFCYVLTQRSRVMVLRFTYCIEIHRKIILPAAIQVTAIVKVNRK